MQKERNNNLIKSSISSLLARLVTVSSLIIIIPFIMNYLGAERFSVWIILTNLNGYFQFLDLGLGLGLQNSLTRCYGKGDNKSPVFYITTSYVIISIIALILSFVSTLVYFFVPIEILFKIKASYIEETRLSFFFFSLATIWSIPLSLNLRILSAYQKDYINKILVIFGRLISVLYVFISIYCKIGMPFLIGGFVILPSIISGSYGLWMFYKNEIFRPRKKAIKFSLFREIITSSLWILVAQIAASARIALPAFTISSLFGTYYASQFGILQRLIMLVSNTLSGLMQPFWPAYGEAYYKKDYKWILKIFKRTILITSLISFLVIIPMVLKGEIIISLWIGKDSIIPDTNMILLTAVSLLFINYIITISMLLNGLNCFKLQGIFGIVITMMATILSHKLYEYIGINGVVWITQVLPNFFIMIALGVQVLFVIKKIYANSIN